MIQYRVDDRLILNAGDHLGITSALLCGFELQPLPKPEVRRFSVHRGNNIRRNAQKYEA
jgi:hypothetical protein